MDILIHHEVRYIKHNAGETDKNRNKYKKQAQKVCTPKTNLSVPPSEICHIYYFTQKKCEMSISWSRHDTLYFILVQKF